MKELQIYKVFIKYLALLLNRLDIEKLKDDFRKIGLTFTGASLLGIVLQKAEIVPGLLILLMGLYFWYLGITKREENE